MKTEMTGLCNVDGSPATMDVAARAAEARELIRTARHADNSLFAALRQLAEEQVAEFERRFLGLSGASGPELLSASNGLNWALMTLDGQTQTARAVIRSGKPWSRNYQD